MARLFVYDGDTRPGGEGVRFKPGINTAQKPAKQKKLKQQRQRR
jgi:hypothetical protein